MENKSFIQGTTWAWRKGHIRFPMHSFLQDAGNFTTDELCLPFSDETQAQLISHELANNGIHTSIKHVHTSSKNIRKGEGILYARTPHPQIEIDENDFEDCATNLKKLKTYIFQNGGKIQGEKSQTPSKKFNLLRFFTEGRK